MNKTIGLHAIACFAALSLGGCGDSLTVDRVEALGTVGGLVIDAESRQPLVGVSVGILAGGERLDPVLTGDDGWFSFRSVPAGEILVTMNLAGFQDAWVRKLIPSNAGEFPTGNAAVTVGPIGLVPVGEPLTVRVLDQSGGPASQYELSMLTFAQYVDFTEGSGASSGETVATAVTDSEGYAQFTAAPDFYRLGSTVDDSVVFLLPPRDGDLDGINEFPGGSQLVNWRTLNDPTPDIILDAAFNATLGVRASTIPSLVAGDLTTPAAVVAPNGSLYVLFNTPIDSGSVVVNVADEQGQPLSSAPNISVRDDTLEIAFASAPLAPGSAYNVQIHAVSAIGDEALAGDFAGSFFTRSNSGAVTAELIAAGGNNFDVVFSEPIGLGKGQATILESPNCVVFFEADLDGSAVVGDAANELDNAACSVVLVSNEPVPAGLPGPTGYTRFWRFAAPTLASGVPLPSGTNVHFLFSHVVNGELVIGRADGSQVLDLTGSTVATIP